MRKDSLVCFMSLVLFATLLFAGCGGGEDDSTNTSPVANAGADQSVTLGTVVTLDGSTSYDTNGDALTYLWTIVDRPSGSTAILSLSTSESSILVPDIAGSYTIQLIVTDATLDTSTDIVVVSCYGSSEQITVVPLYSINGANWNDYVSDDGVDSFNASDTACDPSTDISCLHGGQMRSAVVLGRTSCTALTVDDSLQVFEWTCDDSDSLVRFISIGFKPDKGLSNLIDFDSGAFLENQLTIRKSGVIIANSTPEVWWGNDIVVNNDGSDGFTDMNAGEIHIVTQNANTTYNIGANRVALIIKPGVTLIGSASANSRNFSWLEGVIEATGHSNAINFASTGFSVLRNVSTLNSSNCGVLIDSSSNNSLNNITASGSYYGVCLDSSTNNSLNNIAASENDFSNVYLYSSTNNSLSNITTSGYSYNGVHLDSSTNNSLNNITVSGIRNNGIFLDSSTNNSLNNITASENGFSNVYLYSSTNNSLNNITASESYFSVQLDSSTNNSLSNITASGNDWAVYLVLSSNNILNNITTSGSGYGVNISFSSNNNLNNITASGNDYGVYLNSSSSSNTFTGKLQVGDNSISDCYVSGGIDHGLVNGTCASQGNSDANLTTGVSVASSFVDVINGNYSLLNTDTVIRDVLTVPTGNDTLAHTWSDTSTTDLLRNAVEIQNDGLGNENTLCESGETCLYTPNIAAYQGHGTLVSAGAFTDGTLNGITLLRYESNGY